MSAATAVAASVRTDRRSAASKGSPAVSKARTSPAALDASMELLPDLLRRCAIERARRAAAEDAGTECVVCLEDARSVAFGCGHLCVCEACAPTVVACPLCREPVRAKQRIYFD